MASGGILVLGCSDASANIGLKADERAITVLQVPAATVSTGLASMNAEGHTVQIIETTPTVLGTQIGHAIGSINCKVVKIGAMLSEEAVKIVSQLLQQNSPDLVSVMDVESFFKTGPAPPKPEVVAALWKDLLPSITLLSATVPEAMRLLEDAGVPVHHPRGIPDVQAMAKTLAKELGPQYVVIKREFIDEDDGATTLHYVLVGGGASADAEALVMATSRSENPSGEFGASYFIPSVIAAYLAMGHSVPEAVSAGFGFIGEMLKGGQLFQ